MRIQKNQLGELIVQTPFGNIEQSILKQILPEIGIKWKKDSWVYISEIVKIRKKNGKYDEMGDLKEERLPIRSYNFELALHKAKKATLTDEELRQLELAGEADRKIKAKDPSLSEIQRALSYGWSNQYLPALLQAGSYSELYRQFGLG
jgi:hypothetical protein